MRLHSECLTGDVLGSLRCDCGAAVGRRARADRQAPLRRAAVPAPGRARDRPGQQDPRLRAAGPGARHGRRQPGARLARRSARYASAAAILRSLGSAPVRLLTNNPLKSAALELHGVQVVERVPFAVPPNPVNLRLPAHQGRSDGPPARLRVLTRLTWRSSVWFPRAAPGRATHAKPVASVGPDGRSRPGDRLGHQPRHRDAGLSRPGARRAGARPADAARLASRFPIKYGYASVGRVVEVGLEVQRLAVGRRRLRPPSAPDRRTSCPRRWPCACRRSGPELGVFLANVETAVNIVLDAAPRLGERVAVFGQGVVGLLITQLLRRTGVSQIVASSTRSPGGASSPARSGADAGRRADARELRRDGRRHGDRGQRQRRRAGRSARRSVAFGGTVVCARGTAPSRSRCCSAAPSIVAACASSARRSRPSTPRCSRAGLHQRRLALARDLLPRLELGALISHRIPFEQAAEAYALVDAAA